jgi:hypothetical protein
MVAQNRTDERKLPVGLTEFEKLISDLKTEYAEEMPTTDDASLKFVLASTIMHLGPLDSHKSLDFFYKTVVAGAAKQVAHHIFQDTKRKQEEAARAEVEKQSLEATSQPSLTVVSNEPQG